MRNLVDSVAKGGNFMVAVGPDGDGQFHSTALHFQAGAGQAPFQRYAGSQHSNGRPFGRPLTAAKAVEFAAIPFRWLACVQRLEVRHSFAFFRQLEIEGYRAYLPNQDLLLPPSLRDWQKSTWCTS